MRAVAIILSINTDLLTIYKMFKMSGKTFTVRLKVWRKVRVLHVHSLKSLNFDKKIYGILFGLITGAKLV